MSIFHEATITCPHCATKSTVERSASVNADLRPDLRDAILDGSFQATECPKCGRKLRLPPHLTYLDVGRGAWIAAEPASLLEGWDAVEDEIWHIYDRSFGSGASKAARDVVSHVHPRLVFGWPAFREKLIAADLGLDDITLELLKMSIMRHVDHAPITDETELRLTGGDRKTLQFAWFHQTSEEIFARLDVPRDVYDDIVANADTWAHLREKLDGAFLVDLRRFTAGKTGARAA